MGYNLLDMLKSPHVVSVAIYLPPATHPDPSLPPPPPPSFCLYPSTQLVPVKKDVPVIFLSSLLLSLILFSFPAIHIAGLYMSKMGQNVAILYFTSSFHPNSLLHPNPFHRYTPLTLLITFRPRFLALSLRLLPPHYILSSHPAPLSSKALSSSRYHPPIQWQASTHLSTYCIYRT